jgi:predicted SnoaL-like aldol condensation-catalyzing enzyme
MLASQGVPKQKIEFGHVFAEGDKGCLHSHYEIAGKEWRFIDIYRLQNDKFVEHVMCFAV